MNGKRRHILRSFDGELEQLRAEVIRMGDLVSKSVENSITGLLQGNLELCRQVIAGDEEVDRLEKQIDEQGMSVLLLHTPVASDLRMVVSSLNICRSMERIGDHAVNISKRAIKIIERGGCSEISMVEPLFEEVRKVVTSAMISYADVDGNAALQVLDMDGAVDKIDKRLTKQLTALMGEDEAKRTPLLHLLFTSRSLERIADLAVNIAEDLFFITSAEDIRHS
jgi:phosphate transport system protein